MGRLVLTALLLSAALLACQRARALGLAPAQLAVVINTADPTSAALGEYYVQRRHIPLRNVVRVAFDSHRSVMPLEEFAALKALIDRRLPAEIQAYVLTWVRPYRVGCMSITAAFAFGFDQRYCAIGCAPTALSPYFNSDSRLPFDELHMRPAMSLAALSVSDGKALIDRGIAADGTAPQGTAYLVSTGDPARDVRLASYADTVLLSGDRVRIQIVDAPALTHRNDVMFYFIGAARVVDLNTNRFLPGALADHLTSFGGALTDSSQMSSLRWLEAGATASYGTVVEPCNFPTKFPNPALVLRHYLAGETAIEAYWKSVAMPGQGIFVGEPLAAPYPRRKAQSDGTASAIQMSSSPLRVSYRSSGSSARFARAHSE
jgi:uncharacterized protein (TIGR03790 family)